MRINPVVKNNIKEAGRWAFGIGAFALACCIFNKANNIAVQKERAARDVVEQYNPALHKEMDQRNAGLYTWQHAAESIQDSLRKDSIAKTNYALGMQAVRDSIANANKK